MIEIQKHLRSVHIFLTMLCTALLVMSLTLGGRSAPRIVQLERFLSFARRLHERRDPVDNPLAPMFLEEFRPTSARRICRMVRRRIGADFGRVGKSAKVNVKCRRSMLTRLYQVDSNISPKLETASLEQVSGSMLLGQSNFTTLYDISDSEILSPISKAIRPTIVGLRPIEVKWRPRPKGPQAHFSPYFVDVRFAGAARIGASLPQQVEYRVTFRTIVRRRAVLVDKVLYDEQFSELAELSTKLRGQTLGELLSAERRKLASAVAGKPTPVGTMLSQFGLGREPKVAGAFGIALIVGTLAYLLVFAEVMARQPELTRAGWDVEPRLWIGVVRHPLAFLLTACSLCGLPTVAIMALYVGFISTSLGCLLPSGVTLLLGLRVVAVLLLISLRRMNGPRPPTRQTIHSFAVRTRIHPFKGADPHG